MEKILLLLQAAATMVTLSGLAGYLISYCPINSFKRNIAGRLLTQAVVVLAIAGTVWFGHGHDKVSVAVVAFTTATIMIFAYFVAWRIRRSYSRRIPKFR